MRFSAVKVCTGPKDDDKEIGKVTLKFDVDNKGGVKACKMIVVRNPKGAIHVTSIGGVNTIRVDKVDTSDLPPVKEPAEPATAE